MRRLSKVGLLVWGRAFGQEIHSELLESHFCQNVMFFQQNIDVNMKFRYSLMIIDISIDEKQLNSPQKKRNPREGGWDTGVGRSSFI